MKKIILSMVFVFASVAMGNANSNVEIVENINSNNSVDGTPSECVRSSRNATLALADEFGWDVSSGGTELSFALDVYMIIYLDCLNN
ncbi:MAG: hypothetical protein Q7J19_07320 [Lutibacter sp.]|jgi:hypothetical protein|nr:hypothetical protein [Lutibacter sp.]HSQ46832.1 hypothetical protein [Lutibacter sp.]